MAWKGIKHKPVGEAIDNEAEWVKEDLHELANGSELPVTGNAGEFFYLTTDGHLYIWRE